LQLNLRTFSPPFSQKSLPLSFCASHSDAGAPVNWDRATHAPTFDWNNRSKKAMKQLLSTHAYSGKDYRTLSKGLYKTLILCVFILTSSGRVLAQTGSTKTGVNCWATIGPEISEMFPGQDLYYGRTVMPGVRASLNVEYKQIVYTVNAYAIDNFGSGVLLGGDNSSGLDACSFLIGWRTYGEKGSFILSAGVSKGSMYVTTGDAGYTTGNWLFDEEVYTHYVSDFIGLPVSIRFLTKGKHVGAEFGLYCNFHKYTDAGLNVSFSFGKRK
jgi:hypothetical protein